MAGLLGVQASAERLQSAVERSTADRLRKLEKTQGQEWASTKGTRQDMSFIRAAKDRQWESELPKDSILQIEKSWGSLMSTLGYDLVSAGNDLETPRAQGGVGDVNQALISA
jgi:hypothetical protein